jgi:hypothetical protein
MPKRPKTVPVLAPRGQRKVSRGEMPPVELPPSEPRSTYDNPVAAPRVLPLEDAVRALSLAWLDEYVARGTEADRRQALYLTSEACLRAGCTEADVARAKRLAWMLAEQQTVAFVSNPAAIEAAPAAPPVLEAAAEPACSCRKPS